MTNEKEPLAGLGPLTGPLDAAATFFDIDRDLVQAAAEQADDTAHALAGSPGREAIAALSETEKTDYLLRVAQGDPTVGAELRRSTRSEEPGPGERTVAELLARAEIIRQARQRAAAKRREEEERRRRAEAERERRRRLDALVQRGESVWTEIESEIARCNASGYDRASALLHDLAALAAEDGTGADFARRLDGIRERHSRKARFLDRLKDLEAG